MFGHALIKREFLLQEVALWVGELDVFEEVVVGFLFLLINAVIAPDLRLSR